MLKAITYLFYSELLLLWRHSYEWLYPLGFFVIVVTLFPLALTPDPLFLQKCFPGVVWIAALFASLLSVENIFLSELEDGNLEQLLLSQLPLSLILLIKLGAHWLASEVPLILLTPLLSIFFHLSSITVLALFFSLLLGTPILTCIGCFGVALTLGLRQPGIFLGLLILPLSIPVLIIGVMIVQQAQSGLDTNGALAFLASLTLLALTFLPWTIATTLKISLDN